jgi:energy-coupling factor transporter ATP-binding protein EcfA2
VDIEPGSAVVLITGVMAAGKSTVAELMAGRLPRAAHVRGDVFRRMIVSGREELLPVQTAEARSQLELCYRLSALVADEYPSHGTPSPRSDSGHLHDDVLVEARRWGRLFRRR